MRASSGPELLLSALGAGAAAVGVPPSVCLGDAWVSACDTTETRLEARDSDSGPSAASPAGLPTDVPDESMCAAARGDRSALLRGVNGERMGADEDPGVAPGESTLPERARRASSVSSSVDVEEDSARPVDSEPAGRSATAVSLLSWASMVAAPTPMLTR